MERLKEGCGIEAAMVTNNASGMQTQIYQYKSAECRKANIYDRRRVLERQSLGDPST